MAFQSTDKGRVIVALESTQNEDAVDAKLGTVTEDIVYQAVRNGNIITPSRNDINPPRLTSGGAGTAKASTPNECSVSAEVGFTGLREDSDLPDWHPWFVASNMGATVDAGNSVTYAPIPYTEETLSIYEFRDDLNSPNARLQKSTGAVGSFTLQAGLDQEMYFSWEGTGTYFHPGKSFEYYDGNGSLQYKEDGTTGFTSHDQTIEVVTFEEGYVYRVMINGFEFSHEGQPAETVDDVATALASAINSSTDVDVDATANAGVIDLTATAPLDRFYAKLPRREENMTIFSRERWSNLDDIIKADAMTIEVGGISVQCSSFSMAANITVEGVRTITGSTGTTNVIGSRPNDVNVEVTMEIMDGNEAVYNQFMDAAEEDGFFAVDIRGSNEKTDLHIQIDHMQVALPSLTESGQFVGWTITGMLSGDWSKLDGGDDFTIKLTHK